ncbi:hypothetical protein J8281_09425 [Aquimarina sp. U1-2]|uniref:cytochrome c oxidase assembly factor Coa1 family protein n=1 Tax=Aquimarina sp. U1-2 TaxID=2823141 RepID=UPI001AEC878E|nr:cytochrome c oxidase assembly factor Coa1 family protein [Aquimarina sp. U1-2]MBP2832404.1 hypothetical protein [Aquimarina sp. U1-2]
MERLRHKNWFSQNRKWAFPVATIVLFITIFFYFTGDATFRYGAVHLQPGLIEEARNMASKNEMVIEKLGTLRNYNFLRLIEGEVRYSDDDNTVHISVNLLGSKKKGKLDILAHKKQGSWEYQNIAVRIKKPKKETIEIFGKGDD